MANATDELTLVIHARDNRTPNDTIFLQAWVDHAPLPACHSSCEQGANRSPAKPAGWDNGVPVFRYPLGRLGEGRHTIVVNAFDAACNKVSITKEITVVAFGEEGPALPGAPTASLVVQGDLEAVRPDAAWAPGRGAAQPPHFGGGAADAGSAACGHPLPGALEQRSDG